MLAVVQVAKESLSVFENTNCLYTIEVINNNDVYAVLQKEARSNKVNVISLM
jgi:hypothetical protein